MKGSLLIFVAVAGFVGLVSGGTNWDEYLGDSVPDVKLVEEERKPSFEVGPTKEDCRHPFLIFMIDSEEKPVSLKRKTLDFCKKEIENDTINKLAKLNSELKIRVNSLIESMIAANGCEGFKGENYYMPDRSIQEGILLELQQRGVDLNSIKIQQFEREFKNLQVDCIDISNELYDISSYTVYLNNKDYQPEPTVAQWTRNVRVCRNFKERLRYDTYQLLEARARDKTKSNQTAFKCLGFRVTVTKKG